MSQIAMAARLFALVLCGVWLACAAAQPIVSFVEAASLVSQVPCSAPDTCCFGLKCPHNNGICCADGRSCCPQGSSCLPSVGGQPQQCGMGFVRGPVVRVPCPTCNDKHDINSYVQSLNAQANNASESNQPSRGTSDEALTSEEDELRNERQEKRKAQNERFEKQLQSQTNEALLKVSMIKTLQAGQNAMSASASTTAPEVSNNNAVQAQNELLTKMLVDVQLRRVADAKQQAKQVETDAEQKLADAQKAAAAAAASASTTQAAVPAKPQDDEDDKVLKSLHEEVQGIRGAVHALSDAQTAQLASNQLHAIIAVRKDVDGMRAELERLKAQKETSQDQIDNQAKLILDTLAAKKKPVVETEQSKKNRVLKDELKTKAKEMKLKQKQNAAKLKKQQAEAAQKDTEMKRKASEQSNKQSEALEKLNVQKNALKNRRAGRSDTLKRYRRSRRHK